MNRRDFLGSALSIGAASALLPQAVTVDAWAGASLNHTERPSEISAELPPDDDARALQRSTLVVDGLDVSAPTDDYFKMLKAGGVDCWHISMGNVRSFADIYNLLDSRKGVAVAATTVADIRKAHSEGKLALMFGWQAGDVLQAEVTDALAGPETSLRAYYQLGLRVVGLAYNIANIYGGGCLEPNVHLTGAGRRLVEEIHKLKIVLDVGGHTGEQTSFDAIEMSPGVPIICSHTNVAALNPNPRCSSDRLIEAIAKSGGVVGLSAFNDFHARTAKDAKIKSTPQVGLEKHLDQYDYLRKLVGADHIGIGPDFVEGRNLTTMNPVVLAPEAYSQLPWFYVKGFEKISELPNLTKGLMDRGWSNSEIRKILGENWLRVYESVWRA